MPRVQHRRERSVDLLSQPDMLAALLGSPAAQGDEWGGGGSPSRTHTRAVSFQEDQYSLPPLASQNLDGDMAIPEPVPYTEAEAVEVRGTSSPACFPAASSPPPPAGAHAPRLAQDAPPPAEKGTPHPAAGQASSIPAAPDNPFEAPPLSQEEGETLVEGSYALQPPGPIVAVPLETASSTGQPLSARLEHDSQPAVPRLPSWQR